MNDDLANRGPADRNRISLTEAWEVRYWTKEFGSTEAQLREAVGKVGHMASDVRLYLSR